MTRGEQLVRLTIDGVVHQVPAGVSVAVALLLTGHRQFGATGLSGAPRAVFCGMGSCFECVATVDGAADTRTCITPVADAMTVETRAGVRSA